MKRAAVLIAPLALSVLVAGAVAAEAQTSRVSVASDGTQGNGDSSTPAVSGDGRFVAFTSDASNLVAGNDRNGSKDVFVHDRQTGRTFRVSVASDGTGGNNDSYEPAISANGQFVAFTSGASNLVPNDVAFGADVFLHDSLSGTTTRVSESGAQANAASHSPSLSANGRFLAFTSNASNLVPADRNGASDIFVRDLHTGGMTIISVATDGTQANRHSEHPAISADGRFVAFESLASNLVPFDSNDFADVFVHDRETGETSRATVHSDDTPFNGHGSLPAISADGRFVAFEVSESFGLVMQVRIRQIHVRDRVTRQTTIVSVASDGSVGNSDSWRPALSGDGRYVAFASFATNLTPGPGGRYLFVHDRLTRQTTRPIVAGDGTHPNGFTDYPALSTDGRVVASDSRATNLVPGDTNAHQDVFVRVLQAEGVPGSPSNLTAQVRGSNVTFTWSAPAAGGPVATYVFRAGLNTGATSIEFANGGTATSYDATNVPAGVYYVRVHARNSFGTGLPSNEVMVAIGAACTDPPQPPAGLSATVSGRSITFRWGASPGCAATSYVLEAGGATGASNRYMGNVGNATSLVATAPPGTYYVRVRGLNAFGASGPSNEVMVTVR